MAWCFPAFHSTATRFCDRHQPCKIFEALGSQRGRFGRAKANPGYVTARPCETPQQAQFPRRRPRMNDDRSEWSRTFVSLPQPRGPKGARSDRPARKQLGGELTEPLVSSLGPAALVGHYPCLGKAQRLKLLAQRRRSGTVWRTNAALARNPTCRDFYSAGCCAPAI